MEKVKQFLRHLMKLILVLAILYPAFNGLFSLVKEKKLDGAIVYSPDTIFTWKGWWDGSWQGIKEEYLKERFGTRNFFIRLNHELDYRLFGRIHVKKVVIGKENYLYESDYISTYLGKDFQGNNVIDDFTKKLKRVQQILERKGKTFLIVLAVGKGSFYPEYFPEEFDQEKRGPTNYEAFIKYAKLNELSHIDFSSYFNSKKGKTPYLLYPKYGIHWSQYAMTLAADSMINYFEKQRGESINHLAWSGVELENARDIDYDLGSSLNLFSYLKGPKMGYPNVHVDESVQGTKPSILVIGDSFYWGIFTSDFSSLFSKSHFWYYYNEVYPEHYSSSLTVKDLNLLEEINGHEIIVIMATEHNIAGAGWGFVDALLNLESELK